jgi:hypothetical protein
MRIRPATLADVEAFYGKPKVPVRMVVLEDEQGLAGIGGLAWLDIGVFAASWLTPRAKADRRALVRAVRAVQSLIEDSGETVYARADADEPTAAGFLPHCGFERLDADLYVYRGLRHARPAARAVPADA